MKTFSKDYFECEIRKMFENKGYKTKQLSGLGMECDSVCYYDGIVVGKTEEKIKRWFKFIPHKVSSIKSLGYFNLKKNDEEFKITLHCNGKKSGDLLVLALDNAFLEKEGIELEQIIDSE